MAFKLLQDGGDFPVLVCDVCAKRILDYFGDLASGTRVDGAFTDIVIHHKACATQQPVHMVLSEFLSLFMARNRVGDLASEGGVERVSVNHATGKEFEA